MSNRYSSLTEQTPEQKNLGLMEQVLSTAAGVYLATSFFGGKSRRWAGRTSAHQQPLVLRALQGLGAGYLLARGVSGRDPIYHKAGIVRARQHDVEGIEVSQAVVIRRARAEVYLRWLDEQPLAALTGERQMMDDPEDRGREIFPRPIEWKAEPVDHFSSTGRVMFEELASGAGTRVQVHMVYWLSGGSAGAMLLHLLGRDPAQFVQDALKQFKLRLESDEIVNRMGQLTGRVMEIVRQDTRPNRPGGWVIRPH